MSFCTKRGVTLGLQHQKMKEKESKSHEPFAIFDHVNKNWNGCGWINRLRKILRNRVGKSIKRARIRRNIPEAKYYSVNRNSDYCYFYTLSFSFSLSRFISSPHRLWFLNRRLRKIRFHSSSSVSLEIECIERKILGNTRSKNTNIRNSFSVDERTISSGYSKFIGNLALSLNIEKRPPNFSPIFKSWIKMTFMANINVIFQLYHLSRRSYVGPEIVIAVLSSWKFRTRMYLIKRYLA